MPSESWSLQLAVIAQGKAIAQDRCGSSRLLVAASLSLGHPAICGVGRQTGAPALSPPTWSRPQPHLCDSAFQTNLFGGGVEVKLQVLSSNFTKNSSISLVHQRQFSEMRKKTWWKLVFRKPKERYHHATVFESSWKAPWCHHWVQHVPNTAVGAFRSLAHRIHTNSLRKPDIVVTASPSQKRQLRHREVR